MARVVIDDCLERIPNRFDLVYLASERARQLDQGGEPTIPSKGDKSPVVALREIAEGTITANSFEEGHEKNKDYSHTDQPSNAPVSGETSDEVI